MLRQISPGVGSELRKLWIHAGFRPLMRAIRSPVFSVTLECTGRRVVYLLSSQNCGIMFLPIRLKTKRPVMEKRSHLSSRRLGIIFLALLTAASFTVQGQESTAVDTTPASDTTASATGVPGDTLASQPRPTPLGGLDPVLYGGTSVTQSYEADFPSGVTRWPAFSSITINGEVRLGRQDTLYIGPGTNIKMGPAAMLTIEGQIFARGTSKNPIQFEPQETGSRWGRLLLDTGCRAVYDDQHNYQSGSIVEWATFVGGGEMVAGYEAGLVLVNGGSPALRYLQVEGGLSQNGGGIALINGARSTVRNCTVLNNEALGNGGGVYISLNANVFLEDNLILNNKAGRDGGGVYLSLSPSAVVRNVIERNLAGRDGGGLALNGSSPTVRLNVFRKNESENEGANIVYRSGTPTVKENSFITGEDNTAITTQSSTGAFQEALDGTMNFYGTSDPILLDRKYRDRNFHPDRPPVVINPVLEAPADSTALRPDSLWEMEIYEDPQYNVELPTSYVGLQSYLYLQLIGRGAHPKVRDWALVDVETSSGDQIRVIMRETEPNSGTFRATMLT
ncbi:hypothetical protein GF324_09055, partial [bacterium]|nr:hypothetical protein [bacterium]